MLLGSKPDIAIQKNHCTAPQAGGQDVVAPIWLYFICAFGIILFSNSIDVLLSFGRSDGVGPLQIIRLISYTCFIGIIALMFLENKPIFKAMGFLLSSLLGLSILSLTWSISPIDTFIKTYGLIGCTMLGVILALKFSWAQFFKLVLYSYIFIILATFMICIFMPSVGVHIGDLHHGSWKGAFGQKNVLGRNMVFAFILLFFAAKILRGFNRLLAVIFATLALCLVFLSTSTTSLLALVILMAIAFTATSLHKHKKLLAAIGICSVIIMIPLLLMYPIDFDMLSATFFEQTGKDVTLTGRTTIWMVAVEHWLNRAPLFGFGYGGFWQTPEGSYSIDWGMYAYIPPYAHNGLVQLGTDLGLIGLCVGILYLLSSANLSWNYIPKGRPEIAAFPLIIFVATLFFNISEVTFLLPRNVLWILFVYSITRARIDLKGIRPPEKTQMLKPR